MIIRPGRALFSEETGDSGERTNFPSVVVRVRGGSGVGSARGRNQPSGRAAGEGGS